MSNESKYTLQIWGRITLIILLAALTYFINF
ncbi:hypothetical protein J2Y60_004829 [Arcicella sp. BE140]|nr:hypothetical protein [Arcicella sp. BE51]MDR6814611.1 hypothetical protein [Arcicella sp. BE140]MDR6825989.1 hypothetical protein [Arcicella sp. BE139]